MSRYYECLNSRLNAFLAEKNMVTDLLTKAEKSTGVKKQYIAQGLIAVFSLYMILGHFAQLICNVVGFLYPAYCSIHALESQGGDDDTKWLTYWVVYAFFGLFEFFSDLILGWFPFYWLAKIAFLIWCFNPLTNGSLVVYSRIIRPLFLRNQSRIDSAVSAATGAVLSQASKIAAGDKNE